MIQTNRQFTAVYKKRGSWYLGWVEEISGVNTQGKTITEVKENLREALVLVLEVNKIIAYQEMKEFAGEVIREPIFLPLQ